jgi:uncharacterized protein DUF5709
MTLRDEDEFDPTDNDQEEMVPLGDTPLGATEYGITAEEERTPESMEDRLRREEPEVMVGMGEEDEPVGRLVEEDQGVAGLDKERDAVATASGDDEVLSAEEAAMHEVDL